MTKTDESAWFSVTQVARERGVTESYVRQRFNEGLVKGPESANASYIRNGRQRLFPLEFVKGVFPSFDELKVNPDMCLPADLRRGLGQYKSLPASILAILPGRRVEPRASTDLLSILIERGEDLRIRAVAGTFLKYGDPWDPIAHAFENRNGRKLATKVLLLYPESPAARLRSLAEQPLHRPFRNTAMWLNARRAVEWACHWQVAFKGTHCPIEVKWTDVPPSSMVIYTSNLGTLLEPYDLGRTKDDLESECSGGLAPLLFIDPKSSQNARLRNAFDFVFSPSEDVERFVKIWTLKDLRRHFQESGGNARKGDEGAS